MSPPQIGAGPSLQWLGTSGFALAYQGYRLLIDPYVTRFSLADIVRRRRVAPSATLVNQLLSERTDAILIGHTHFDHAADAPLIAARDRCPVYGSRSMVNLMNAHGLRDQSVQVEVYRTYELGPFEVTFIPSRHSKLVLGRRVPYAGDITCDHVDHLTAQTYCCGQVFGIHIRVAGITLYHQGSADLVEDAIRHRGVDIFLAGIAGRGYTRDYVRRIVRCLEPKVIVPHHYDDFFRPLSASMRFSFNVNFEGFVEEVRRVSNEFDVRSLEPLRQVDVGP